MCRQMGGAGRFLSLKSSNHTFAKRLSFIQCPPAICYATAFRTLHQVSPLRSQQQQQPPDGLKRKTPFSFDSRQRPQHATLPSSNTLSFSQRFKALTKEYGRYAVMVYFGISMLDLPVAYGLVQLLGIEHVKALQEWVLASLSHVTSAVTNAGPPADLPGSIATDGGLVTVPKSQEVAASDSRLRSLMRQWGISSTTLTAMAMAYTIHKTVFLPVRVAATAAVTPPLVKWLRRRGIISIPSPVRQSELNRKSTF